MTGEAPIAQRYARHHRTAQEQMILYTERVRKPYDPKASKSRWCPLPSPHRHFIILLLNQYFPIEFVITNKNTNKLFIWAYPPY